MSRYEQLEKIALNAEKSRMMAKEVGIVPEGAWKWALRKSRNMHTGELLKGKELSDAHKSLGKISNNAYLGLKKGNRKLVPNTEIGAVYSEKYNNIVDGVIGPNGKNTVTENINGYYSNLHTHPGHAGESRFHTIASVKKELSNKNNPSSIMNTARENLTRMGTKKRNPLIADVSGSLAAQGNRINMHKKDMDKLVSLTNKHSDRLNKGRSLYKEKLMQYSKMPDGTNNLKETKLNALNKYKGKMNELLSNYNKNRGALLTSVKGQGGDIDYMRKSPIKRQRIIAPDQDFMAVHDFKDYATKKSVFPNATKRSVFFDMTPRKTRK